MADTNITSLPQQTDVIIGATKAFVYIIDSGTSQNYSGTPQLWPNAQVVSVTLRIGAEPGECVIEVPVSDANDSVGRVSGSKNYSAPDYPNDISRLKAPDNPNARNFMYSQVRIFKTEEYFSSVSPGTPLFVGYIVEYNWKGDSNQTVMRVRCEDARHFWKKAPVQGVIFKNVLSDGGSTVYIRARRIIFNEGNKPNRHVLENGADDNTNFPMFVNENLNRFYSDTSAEWDHHLVSDGEVDEAFRLKKLGGQSNGQPHARKWLPGHAWNYLRLLHLELGYRDNNGDFTVNSKLTKPTSTQLGHDPCEDDFPVYLGNVMAIMPIGEGNDNTQWEQWFKPRALTYSAQTDGTDIQSGLGEWCPSGVALGDCMFELCRKVGNFSLAAEYGTDGKLTIRPIKTTSAYAEIQNGGPQVNVANGAAGGIGVTGGGKSGVIVFPTTNPDNKSERPEVLAWDLKHGSKNYYNRVYFHAGRRWLMTTFSTLGTDDWTDSLGKLHKGYSPPASEWRPNLAAGVLVPGWDTYQQTKWLTTYTDKTDVGAFPDVFRVWLIKDTMDWVGYLNQSVSRAGLRFFLERDRQLLPRLLVRIFDQPTGTYRSRPVDLQFQVWRAYQGIKISDTGTAYGNNSDSEAWKHIGAPIEGKKRWFRCTATVETLSDGRIGFRLSQDARRNISVVFEDTDSKAVGAKTPWSWNGMTGATDAQAYEMFATLSVELDEDLFEYMAIKDAVSEGGMSYQTYGPAMEMHKDAGLEYGEEIVVKSVFDNPFGSDDNFRYRMRCPEPGQVVGQEILTENSPMDYRDGRAEVRARAELAMQRYAMTDLDGSITFDRLMCELKAGEYINEFRVPGDSSIRIGCLLTTLVHDFINQRTTAQVETIR